MDVFVPSKERITFLDLEGCSLEDQEQLESLLFQDKSKPPTVDNSTSVHSVKELSTPRSSQQAPMPAVPQYAMNGGTTGSGYTSSYNPNYLVINHMQANVSVLSPGMPEPAVSRHANPNPTPNTHVPPPPVLAHHQYIAMYPHMQPQMMPYPSSYFMGHTLPNGLPPAPPVVSTGYQFMHQPYPIQGSIPHSSPHIPSHPPPPQHLPDQQAQQHHPPPPLPQQQQQPQQQPHVTHAHEVQHHVSYAPTSHHYMPPTSQFHTQHSAAPHPAQEPIEDPREQEHVDPVESEEPKESQLESLSQEEGPHQDQSAQTHAPEPQDTVAAPPAEVAAKTEATAEEVIEKKSWASLFRPDQGPVAEAGATATQGVKPMGIVSPYTMKDEPEGSGKDLATLSDGVITADDELTQFIKTHTLNHKSTAFRPRGLTNRSNWCFCNAILQALVACPPFFNFMRKMPLKSSASRPPMKITSAIWSFIQDIEIMTSFPKFHRKKAEDLPLGKTVEAAAVFNMLLELNSDTFHVVEGRQEDAEEFLTFLLNGINDEISVLLKLAEKSGGIEDEDEAESSSGVGDDDGPEWKEVGPKNKSCATRRVAISTRTPVADMFQGQTRSCFIQGSGSEPTATHQPFFVLPLDIQSESVHSLTDALINNFNTEPVHGFKCPTTNQEVEASRNLSLVDLPPILVLHLKRFCYDTSGGCQKVLKNIDFPIGLEVPKDILSPTTKNKVPVRQRQYKLFAVVYHNGVEASKGHYVTDLYHTGLASWLRCDDGNIKCITESNVMNHVTNSLPYILFYRRGDTMQGQGQDKANAKSNANTSSSSSATGSSTLPNR